MKFNVDLWLTDELVHKSLVGQGPYETSVLLYIFNEDISSEMDEHTQYQGYEPPRNNEQSVPIRMSSNNSLHLVFQILALRHYLIPLLFRPKSLGTDSFVRNSVFSSIYLTTISSNLVFYVQA